MTAQFTTGPRATAITVVLALLATFPPLSTDMYLAAMPEVARAMHTTDAGAELSLSIFFLGLCFGQMLIGPLIDAFGRKTPLIAGTLVFILSSIGLLLVDDILSFNLLRFVQAVGACSGMVVGRAVVSDLYEGRKAAQVLTILVMLMTLGPILAPFIGSLLLAAFGWRSIFYTLVAFGVLALVLIRVVIPETLPAHRRHPDAFAIAFRRMPSLARRREFILPALIAALVQAPMFAFITASSGVFQGSFGLSSSEYGLLFGLVASALVVFGQINSWLLNRSSPEQILTLSLPLLALAAAGQFALSGTTHLWLLVAPLWLCIGLVGLSTANAMHLAMRGSPEAAGIGSAMIGTIQFGIAFLTSSLVAFAGTDSARPMTATILATCLAALGFWVLLNRGGQKNPLSAPEPGAH